MVRMRSRVQIPIAAPDRYHHFHRHFVNNFVTLTAKLTAMDLNLLLFLVFKQEF